MTKTIRKAFLLIISVVTSTSVVEAQNVRVNQVGMRPDQEKILVIDGIQQGQKLKKKPVKIQGIDNKHFKQSFSVSRTTISPISKKERHIVDLSAIKDPGRYEIIVGKEHFPLNIATHPLHDLAISSLKAFYLIRSGVEIEQQYAGIYARKKAHPDTQVYIHPSAASESRPAGTVISSPYGWYDAGDYNKYVVNSSFACAQMLMAYEEYSDYFDSLRTDIPESGNHTADVLDEVMFNLKWLLTMQDPEDGGVYHKLTTPSFEGMVMPSECHQPRYVVQKTVTASYDFAAVMALAARVYRGNADYPAFSKQAEAAALKAYDWAEAHPTAYYMQNEMNKLYDPDVTTGEYGDRGATDERYWASTELLILTGDKKYEKAVKDGRPKTFQLPVWGNVTGLALLEWVSMDIKSEMQAYSRELLEEYCESLISGVDTSSFQSPFGNKVNDFGWGCLAEHCCMEAVALLYANTYITPGKYLSYAQANADYLLGRNATGYCYVTGFGQKSPQNIHHRISSADGIDAPFPGLLVGGPNPGQQDKSEYLKYSSDFADESYEDQTASYASNEIAINWNSALVALMCSLDAESMKQAK